MRRDFDLVRTILKTCADSLEPVDARVFVDDAHPFELVVYHVHIMEEAGLVESRIINAAGLVPVDATVGPLTWDGNDFLDAVRSDSIWSKTKQRIASTVGSVSFDVLKAVAVKVSTDMLGL